MQELFDEGPNGIRNEDVFDLIASVGKSANGRYMAWFYIREYWNYFSYRFGKNRKLSKVVRTICETFDNKFLLSEVKFKLNDFFLNLNINFDFIDLIVLSNHL